MMRLLADPEFWVAVGFVAIIAIFIRQGAPQMIARSLDARAAAIKAELDEARRLREEAEALLNSYKAKASAAEREAETIVAEARADAERFAADARVQMQKQLERHTEAVRERIGQAEAQAMAELRAVAADAAAAAAEALIAARLDGERQSAIVAQSVRELPERL